MLEAVQGANGFVASRVRVDELIQSAVHSGEPFARDRSFPQRVANALTLADPIDEEAVGSWRLEGPAERSCQAQEVHGRGGPGAPGRRFGRNAADGAARQVLEVTVEEALRRSRLDVDLRLESRHALLVQHALRVFLDVEPKLGRR
jgi:hypothetical protein